MATRKPTQTPEDVAIAPTAPGPSDLAGDGAGELLPNASQEEREAPTLISIPESIALTETAPPVDVKTFSARVLCAVSVGGKRYEPNDVIDGIPADVLQGHVESLDPHPDAVAYAKAQGGKTHRFEA